MHFPKFWERGEQDGAVCWRWSDASAEEARRDARAAAQRVAQRLASGQSPDRYGYADRPLREPVLEEIRGPDGALAAALTCNAYGSTVLNAAHALFVDIDLPEPPTSRPVRAKGFFARMFRAPAPGFTAPPPAAPDGPEAAAVARIEKWTSSRPGWGWRVYRTRAGLRLLATHGLFEPASAEVEGVFSDLGADPLYRQLCRAQKSFRARLTPKPWRCGNSARPPRWPWRSEREALAFDTWHRAYSSAAQGFATCRLLRTFGSEAVVAELREIVRVHDAHTRVGTALPLA